MEAVIWAVALIFMLCLALGTYAVVKVVSAAKRGVDRTVAQARRTVEDTTLKARQYAQPGAAGELAQLRVSLRTSMRATRQALDAAAPEDPSLSEALTLFERLSKHGHELDDELKRLEREPDKGRIAERLPELRERVERVTHSADSLRWAAQDRARHFADDDLAMLGGQIEMEAGALRHWAPGPGGSSADGSRADDPAAGGSRTGDSGGDGSGTGDSRTAGPGEEPSQPAITAADPRRQQAGYPWRKTARRPESTT